MEVFLMNRITINRIITAADKQGQDTASHTYSADAFDANIDNTAILTY